MIRSVGYDRAESMLEIEFCSGSVYQYTNVPQEIYVGLMSADSKGGYFEGHIKEAGYDYQRMR